MDVIVEAAQSSELIFARLSIAIWFQDYSSVGSGLVVWRNGFATPNSHYGDGSLFRSIMQQTAEMGSL